MTQYKTYSYEPFIEEKNLTNLVTCVYEIYKSIDGRKNEDYLATRREIVSYDRVEDLEQFFIRSFNLSNDLAQLLAKTFYFLYFNQNNYLNRRATDFIKVVCKLKVTYDYMATEDNTALNMLYFILLFNIATNISVSYTYGVFGDKYINRLRQYPKGINNLEDFLYHLLQEDKFTQVNMVENRSWIIIDLDIGLNRAQFRHIAKITKELEKVNLAPTFIMRTDKGGFQVFYAVNNGVGNKTLDVPFNILWYKMKDLVNLYVYRHNKYIKIKERVEEGKAGAFETAIVETIEWVTVKKNKAIRVGKYLFEKWLFTHIQANYIKKNNHNLNITPSGLSYTYAYAIVLSVWQELLEEVAGDVKKYKELYKIDDNAIERFDATPRLWRNLLKNRLIYFNPKLLDISNVSIKGFINHKYASIWLSKINSEDKKVSKNNKITKKDKKSKIKTTTTNVKKDKNLPTEKELMFFERNFDFNLEVGKKYYQENLAPLCQLYDVNKKEEELFKKVWYNGFVENTIPTKIIDAKFQGSQGKQWGFMALAYHFVPTLLIQPEMKNQGLPTARKTLKKFLFVTFSYINTLIKNPLENDELFSFIENLFMFYTTNYKSRYKDSDYEVFMFSNVKRRLKAVDEVETAILNQNDFSEIANDINKIKKALLELFTTTKKTNFKEIFGIAQSTYYKWINQDLFDELLVRLALRIQVIYEAVNNEELSQEEKSKMIREALLDIEFVKFIIYSVKYRFYLAQRLSTYDLIDNIRCYLEEEILTS